MKINKIANPKNESHITYCFWCVACDEVHCINNQWTFNEDLDNPTFNPSVLVQGIRNESYFSPRCHLFIQEGKLKYLPDCEHDFRGQTVEMIDVDLWRYR